MSNLKVYFNEQLHKYTDEYDNTFTSVTTVISKYVEKFDTEKMAKICSRIGMNPTHPKYSKYKNKTAKQLIKEWEDKTNKALDKGNRKHNYLEDVIKNSNNYNRVKGKFINDRIFTIPDIIKNPQVGVVTLDDLIRLGLKGKYPIIFDTIEAFVHKGWKLYSEICVFNTELLVSGLIDLLLVKGNKFFILDWKTNRDPVKYEAGYYENDADGNATGKFIRTNSTLLHPIDHLADSSGNKYSLQLSTYSYLVELFNMEFCGIILCHIRDEDNKEIVDMLPINYMKEDVKTMLEHHTSHYIKNNQKALFI